ncbi:MAG: DUF3341 domain-containing protein [Acidobacteria bacterium]|nr:DUF3341 domain-containing protein [Acidobacteriota bacterium]
MSEATTTEIYGVVAEFDSPAKLLHAVKTVRERGYDQLEAYTPFPIHGIDRAMGEKRSNLGFVVLVTGAIGALAAIGLQWWTGAVDYPLVIAGKPLFAFEFAVPIIFELTVLFAAFGAVFGMFAFNKLPRLYHPIFRYSRWNGATNDRFLLAVEKSGPSFPAGQIEALLQSAGASHTEVVAG